MRCFSQYRGILQSRVPNHGGSWLLIVGIFVLVLNGSSAEAGSAGDNIVELIAANMVKVPGGMYMMGANPGDTKKKGHWVKVEPFLIGKYEVTQGEYEAVMDKNPSHFTGDRNLPVEQISWTDAQEFIKRLNALEGEEVYRLPTEAEWEYICLAGATNVYGFCNDEEGLGDYAWYAPNSQGRTHPVGQLKPNPWGLYDTHGNVWEWCQDWHGVYPAGAVTTPEGKFTVQFRILRGGAYDSPDGDCRSHTRRSYSSANARVRSIGFRLAGTIPTRIMFREAVKDYPYLAEMVTEEAFNILRGKEQRELIDMIDKYAFFLHEAEYYKQESPATSYSYSQKAGSLKKEIEARFGHALRK